MKRHARSLSVRSRRSKLFAAAAAVVTLALAAVIVPATTAIGQSVSTGSLDAGVLRLRLGAQDHFRFEPTSGSTLTQLITTSSGCRLSNPLPPPSLVAFSSNSGFPGFVDNAIGVRGSGDGNGQPCGRIDPNQTLTMSLGSALSGKLIDFAEIDIEGKFSVTFKVDGYLGSSATPVASETYNTTGSDSGPDSGDGDNFRIRFPKDGEKTAVDRLVFSIVGTTGGTSLEGGADGTGACDAADGCVEPSLGQTLDDTTDSLFHLIEVDGILDCNEQADPQGGGSTPLNELERLDNVGGVACTPIPYNLDSSVGDDCDPALDFAQCVLLQKDLLGQNAQFLWTVTWQPEEGEYQESETEFDFDLDGTFQPIQLCLADSDNDTFPELPPTTDPGDGGAVDPWCVAFTSTDLDFDTGLVVVTETYFGGGDPGGKRH